MRRLAGTPHPVRVDICGYNFSLLIGLASVPAIRLFGRRRAVPILLIAVLAYTVLVGVLGDAVLVTLAAQITTLPIRIVTFRQISILTLIVNGLVRSVPAQTSVMVFGGAALLVGMVWLPLGQILSWLAWLFLAWTIQVIHLFASIPGMSSQLGYVDPVWGVAYYAALALVTFYASQATGQRTEIRLRMTKIISLRFASPALVVVGILAVLALSWRPDGKLPVHALSVDGGSVFVQTPSGRQILIGGSNSPSALPAALGARMPFWDRDIESNLPSIVVTQSPVEPDKLIEGVAFVSAETRPVELIFDGAR